MWYQIRESDFEKLRIGDLLIKDHRRSEMPELLAAEKNEFYIIQKFRYESIDFKRADISKATINYSFASLMTKDLFTNCYWYCFDKSFVM